jgi:hypothetical protein
MKRPDECANAGWKIDTILNTEHDIVEVANVVLDGPRKQTVKGEIGQIAAFPDKIEPMLATPVDAPFDDARWLFEVKWNGYRSLYYVDGERIHSRPPQGEHRPGGRTEKGQDGERIKGPGQQLRTNQQPSGVTFN